MSTAFKDLFGDSVITTGEHENIPYTVVMGPYTINGYIELPAGRPWLTREDYWNADTTVHV